MKKSDVSPFSRRTLMLGGISSFIAISPVSRALSQVLPAPASTTKKRHEYFAGKRGTLVALEETRPTDASFKALLRKHFPGYETTYRYRDLAPYLMIVYNPNGQGIKAIHARWKVTAAGVTEKVGAYCIGAPSPHLGKHKKSGSKVVLKKKSYALITPFGILTSAKYAKLNKTGQVDATINKGLRKRKRLVRKLVGEGSPQVTSSIGGIISDRHLVLLTNSKSLVARYLTIYNAEHDECLSIHKQLKAAGDGSLESLLQQNPMVRHVAAVTDTKKHYRKLYIATRKAYLRKLRRYLRRNSAKRTLKVIKRMKNQHRAKLLLA